MARGVALPALMFGAVRADAMLPCEAVTGEDEDTTEPKSGASWPQAKNRRAKPSLTHVVREIESGLAGLLCASNRAKLPRHPFIVLTMHTVLGYVCRCY